MYNPSNALTRSFGGVHTMSFNFDEAWDGLVRREVPVQDLKRVDIHMDNQYKLLYNT